MQIRFLIVGIIGFLGLTGKAQSSSDIYATLQTQEPNKGVIVIVQDLGIADLLALDVANNTKHNTIDGFRIQLYSGSGVNSKKEAQEVKSAAMSAIPTQKIDLSYTAPFWRVRLGNFRNKSELLPTYYQLKSRFPNCYPVKDNTIRVTDLK